MNTYNAYWKELVREVEADNSYQAQLKASVIFQSRTNRKVKSQDITVMLVAKDGDPVETSTGDL